MIRKEPTKLYLLWKKVPEERQILTTGFEPGENEINLITIIKSSVGTTDTNSGFQPAQSNKEKKQKIQQL
ncbi:MAG: hypothetical protein WBK79_02085, partial [Candidatus Cloacimonas acidaminovorans]